MLGLCGIVVNGHNRKETIIKDKKLKIAYVLA